MILNPIKNDGEVYRAGNTLFGYNGWPSVCRDENNVLYAAFSGHRITHVCPFGKTFLCKSRDGGKSWSSPIVVNDTPLDDRDAGILYLGNGKLLLTWFVHAPETYTQNFLAFYREKTFPEARLISAQLDIMDRYQGRKECFGSFVRVSDDYGESWGETTKVPISSPHGPVLLSDGTLFYVGRDMYTDELTEKMVAAYTSKDNGKTWQFLSKVTDAEYENSCFNEPCAIQFPDGRIMVAIRYENPFTVMTTVSSDGGKTWSELTKTGMVGAPPHLLLHSSGALICTVGRRTAPFGERAYVSYDLGETWEDEYILREDSPDGDLGYPSTVELDDGSLFTVYYQLASQEDKGKRSILYTHWKLKK